MKNIFFLFVAFPLFCFGQGFRKLYSSDTTGAGFVDIIWDGNKLITSGQFLTNTAPNNALNGLLYMELDTNGNTLFTDIYFYPNDAVAPGIGNSLFLSNNGTVYSMNQILYDSLILLALYQNSERIKIKTTPIPGLQKWLYHCVDWAENILLSGRRSNYLYDSEGMLIKSDPLGNEIWRRYYGSPNLYCGIAEPYIVDNNTVILPGLKIYEGGGSISNSWSRTWIITVDSLGNIKDEWESPKNVENGVATRMLKTADGNWLYTTSEFVPIPGQIDDFGMRPKIVCRDSNFNFVWERPLESYPTSANYTIDLQSLSDGNYIVTGRIVLGAFVGGCFIHKFAPGGEGIWTYLDICEPAEFCERHLGGVTELPGGSIVAAGYFENFDEGKSYGLLIKLDKNGCIDTLCSGTTGTQEVDLASKIKVYPNPTSDILTISNPIGEVIDVFDFTGRFVKREQIVGEIHTISIKDLPNGMYIISMKEKKLRVSYKIIKQ